MAEGIPFRALGTSFELVWEMDALRQGREQASFRVTEREQALRWVGFVLDEPHGLRLLRAVLAASPHFEPDRLTDVEVIEEVLKALERRRLRVFQGVDFRGGGTAPGAGAAFLRPGDRGARDDDRRARSTRA
ncbi:MAG: hypothetical protein HY908_36915 [Myxococcales bacterium]|nr:hypothetical protein [Myxococcales bacterium]